MSTREQNERKFGHWDDLPLRNVITRIGAADVRTFGLVWEDCEQLLSELGYSAQVNIVAR